MIFKKSLIGNSRAALAQFNELEMTRRMYAMNEQQFINNGLCVNEGLVPRDVYQEFDNAAVEVMHSDDGDTYLNDLLPLSKSISLGKLVQKYRKVSDSGVVQTSMSGQTGVKNDQTENVYDGAIGPIHDAGFSRNFREMLAQSSEGFDSLIDDQRETVRSVRKHLADQFLDGHVDKSGNAIVIDGLSWGGMRNDSHVAQATLVFDFTDATHTGITSVYANPVSMMQLKLAKISKQLLLLRFVTLCGLTTTAVRILLTTLAVKLHRFGRNALSLMQAKRLLSKKWPV